MLRLNKGFTLIELMVVITIIAILATWGITIYTAQIQKARDTNRIGWINTLKSWIEQYYWDKYVYPSPNSTFWTWISVYVPTFPVDPKSKQSTTNSFFEYSYSSWDDENWLDFQTYEISNTFESQANIDNKANNTSDWWNNAYRYEVWINVDWLNSWSWAPTWTTTLAATASSWVYTIASFCDASTAGGSWTGCIVIAK